MSELRKAKSECWRVADDMSMGLQELPVQDNPHLCQVAVTAPDGYCVVRSNSLPTIGWVHVLRKDDAEHWEKLRKHVEAIGALLEPHPDKLT